MSKQHAYEPQITNEAATDGVDRRGFLKCMSWAGAGLVWVVSGGVPSSSLLSASAGSAADFTFVQISDSHIGFDKPANADATATFQAAVDKVNALPTRPDLVLHTGDLSHLSKPGEFDTVTHVLKGMRTQQIFYVPGEHDVSVDDGKQYLERYGKGTRGAGWQSFDHKGVHFVGLVNVINLKAGGLGNLGAEQIAWLEKDLAGIGSSTPIVVFAHIPLWAVYPEWGWSTADGERALALMKRFGSVTVLNGHIHQIMQKVEGNVSFHTAMSTAFPQPVPQTAPSPGPLKVPAESLRRVLGIAEVRYIATPNHLAVVDSTLAGTPPENVSGILREAAAALPTAAEKRDVHPSSMVAATIGNFAFAPKELNVPRGATVQWTNNDDTPHTVTSDHGVFSSPAMDTRQTFKFTFAEPGTYAYYCKFHPMMTGAVVVR